MKLRFDGRRTETKWICEIDDNIFKGNDAHEALFVAYLNEDEIKANI